MVEPELSSDEARLVTLVDEHRDALFTLLQDLVRIDSRNYGSDVYSPMDPIVEYCEKYLRQHGIDSTTYKCPFPEPVDGGTKYVPNLIAELPGAAPKPDLMFCGHVDVVPFDESHWSDGISPLGGLIRDGVMYGRGTSDMKGGVAGQMMAMILLKKSGLPVRGTLKMWFIPDEETNSVYGAQFMVREHFDDVNTDATIIGEATGAKPIGNAIIVGEKGMQWYRLTFYGAAGHGSMPKPRSNALMKAVRFISCFHKAKIPKQKAPITLGDMLRGLLARFGLGGLIKLATAPSTRNPLDEDGYNPLNFFRVTHSFNVLHAGLKTNVIPSTAVLELDMRVLPGVGGHELIKVLADYSAKIGYRMQVPEGYVPQKLSKKLSNRPVDVELAIISSEDGNFTPVEHPIVPVIADAYRDVYQVPTINFFAPGSTDATHLRKRDVPGVIVFGAGDGDTTHGADECITLEDLVKATKVYLLAAYRFLNRGA